MCSSYYSRLGGKARNRDAFQTINHVMWRLAEFCEPAEDGRATNEQPVPGRWCSGVNKHNCMDLEFQYDIGVN